jgi:hypothetical protein
MWVVGLFRANILSFKSQNRKYAGIGILNQNNPELSFTKVDSK